MTAGRASRLVAALAALVLAVLGVATGGSAVASPGHAAKPGGPIAFVRYVVVRRNSRVVRAEQALYVVSPDGSGLKRLAGGIYAFARPAWSPDGERLVFPAWRRSRAPQQRLNIESVSATGKTLRWLTEDEGHDYDPAWSPRGDRIVFTSDRSDSAGDLWTMRGDGIDERKLLGTKGVQESQARWSPDGTRLVFTRSYGLGRTSLATAVAAGGRVTALRLGAGRYDPAWSPDGKLIAFARHVAGGSRVYVMRIGGGGLRAVTSGPDDEAPAWSPDGRRLVFERHGKGTASALYVVDSSGGGLRQLTSGPQDRAPAWAR